MKKRLGGLLAIALGAVLIGNGLGVSDSSAVGGFGDGQCSSGRIGITPVEGCPQGDIVITDTTPAGAGVPATWDVTITSTNCLDPRTDEPVNRTITVPTGGSAAASSGGQGVGLYIFTNFSANANSPKCSYTLTRAANPAYTVTFTPASPVTIAFDENNQANRVVRVTMRNTALVPTTSAAPTTSAPASPSSSVEPSETAGDPVSASESAGPASDTQGAAPIAETGPRESITVSLWLGIGLVLLGLFLVFEGRVRKLGKHSG